MTSAFDPKLAAQPITLARITNTVTFECGCICNSTVIGHDIAPKKHTWEVLACKHHAAEHRQVVTNEAEYHFQLHK